jgi:tripartite-type tricarboxylate transporter receptor subunit TctC
MFAARHGVLSGPEMGHTAGMARATHLHGRQSGWRTSTALLLGVLAASTPCRAQEAYPAKPIHLIVPSTAGGTTDIVGRALAQALSQRMNASFIVEQRVGGSTNIGMTYVARARPDGYTLLVVTDTLTSNVSTFRDPGYDPVTSFTPISVLARAPGALAVRRDLGVATVEAFMDLARRKGRDLTVASTGTGTVSHLTGIMFRQRMGLPEWTDVPYAGSAKAVTDLIGGHVDAIFSMVVPLVPHAESGSLKIVAVTTNRRSPAVPAVPTVAEGTGAADFDVANWTALLAPAGTPAPIVSKLAAAVGEAMHDPELLRRFSLIGVEAAGDGPEVLAGEIRRTVAQWRDVVRKSGMKVN